jgi:integrase
MKSASVWHLKHLQRLLGDKLLSEFCDETIVGYRNLRSGETIIKHGQFSAKKVSQTTINKEIGSLRKFLHAARKKGYQDKVTEFEMEGETARNRVLTNEEYQSLLESCPPWLKRSCIMEYETCLTRGDLLELTWNEIDLKEGIIELQGGRGKTGAPQVIPILTPELKALMTEL